MRQIQWFRLNDTFAAFNSNRQIVGYIVPLRRVLKPPEKRTQYDRDTLKGLQVETYQTMVKGL